MRVKLLTPTGRSMLVGPLVEIEGAQRWAEDLLADGVVTSVLVERRRAAGGWEPVGARP